MHYFADFNKLKITTDYNYLTKNIYLEVHKDTPVNLIQAEVTKKVKELEMQHTSLPILYDFEIGAADTEFSEHQELVDFLLTVVNIVIPTTLKLLEDGEGYKRERRLDVPDKLKPLHASFGTIKRACNHKIYTPLMNIRVSYNDLFFVLCDGREIDEVKGDSSDE